MNTKMIATEIETGLEVNPFFCVPTNPLKPTTIYIDACTGRYVKVTFKALEVPEVPEVSELLKAAEQIPVVSAETPGTPKEPKTWSGVIWECSVQAVAAVGPIAKKIVVDAVTEAVKQNGKELASNVLKGYSENGVDGALGAAKAGAKQVAEHAKEKAVADVRKKTNNALQEGVRKIF